MWRRAVVAVSVALLATATQAQPHVCPDGQFPVSVLDDPQVRCITSRPCSGVYGPQGLLTGVGACPAGTGCALLPQNPSVMGCVIAGRADVSYVNPDGSLTKGGQVIAGPPANINSGNNAQPTAAPTTATSTAPTPTATNNGANNGANNANKNTTTPAPTTAAPATTLPTTPGSVKPGGGDDATTAPTPTTTSASSAKSDAPATTTATPTNSQNALDNISGEIANNKRGVDAKSLGFTSIIAIVVGCLAVVAIIAGVFVLRKKKEQSIGTPEGALEDYGAGGVTPKENVLLL